KRTSPWTCDAAVRGGKPGARLRDVDQGLAQVQPLATSLQSTSVEYVIEDAVEEDAGVYSCFASNVAGQATSETYLELQVDPPEVTIQPGNITLTIGQEVTVSCRVVSEAILSKMQILFTGPGLTTIVVSNADITPKEDGLYTYNEVISHVNETHGGVYTCEAANKVSDSVEIELLIQPSAQIQGDKNITILNGTGLDLVCNIEAKPMPRILWHRETEKFLNHSLTLQADNMYRSVLSLNSSIDSVEATYFCIAENPLGIAEDGVTVNVRRSMTVLQGFSDSSVELYSQIDVHCQVDSYPPAHMKWFHNGTEILTNTNVHLSEDNTTLTILMVDFEDLGQYECLADNVYESVKVVGSLNVVGL
ncbi:hypothetical protein ACJJTC_014419, partial [Scirpophaga incertulas]